MPFASGGWAGRHRAGYAILGGGPYVSPYLLEILSTRPGAPAFVTATGSLVANTGQTVSCSRAASAYCLGNDGLLHLLGANTVRVEPTGLLREGQSTNTIKNSTAIGTGATWGLTGLTATANAATAPDGNSTAALLQTIAGNTIHRCFDDGSDFNGATRSVYVKRPTSNACRYLTIGDSDLLVAFGSIDLQTGTYVAGSGDSNGTVTALANGWYRLSWQGNTNSFYTLWPGETAVAPPGGYNATGGLGVYVWMSQAENLSFPTSPIITGAAAATRDADIVTVANPLNPSNPGTWRMGATANPASSWTNVGNVDSVVVVLGLGSQFSLTNYARILFDATAGGRAFGDVTDTGGSNLNITPSAPPNLPVPGTPSKLLLTDAAGTLGFLTDVANSYSGSGAGSGTIATQQGTLYLGNASGNSTFGFWGHMTDIVVDNT